MSYTTKIEAAAYATDAGPVIRKSMIALPECTIDPTEPATRVEFMVALLGSDPVWCLFYARGGDWASFGDGDEHNPEMVEEWMPDGIRDCVKAVSQRLGEVAAEDMDWFVDWANAAEQTLSESEEESE